MQRIGSRRAILPRTVLLGLCLAQQPGAWAAGEAGTPARSDSRADHSSLPADVQPWWPSRYGADDQLGTLNEITPEVVRAATALVKTGTVVDLGRVLDDDTPKFPGRYWHQTVDVSPHLANLRRPDVDGKGWGKNQINWITEIQVGTFQVGTQLDSIGHIQIGDRFYNGWTTRDVVESWGLNRFGTETVPPIVTRGVLVDIAAYKGVERLAKGYVITLADVQGALEKQGVTLRPGDAVLFHTGWGGLWGKDNTEFLSGEPGPGLEVVNWLYAQRIALTGADTWSYGPVPGEDPERPFLVPQTMYVKMGLFGLENLATEELARRGVHEFLFTLTHAKTRGSTAAIIAPAAVY
ncbi:MAG: cyclase family protein [Candidatus Contendobacter sp.]|nr:cyclase family protein [Candidatus Contendobacter sp.]MDG4557948.1 cyclase family protein [Candidatus Contendobacter sp.]